MGTGAEDLVVASDGAVSDPVKPIELARAIDAVRQAQVALEQLITAILAYGNALQGFALAAAAGEEDPEPPHHDSASKAEVLP
ncbi:MAG: hypothetical protein J0H96_11730 [Microbacterium ginsengisoli]|jgi:hypothetical protein|nr:hypothetical protein [Microbacterium ginsengisoli]